MADRPPHLDHPTPGRTHRVDVSAAERASSRRTTSDADEVDSPADVEHDRVWQTLLVELLGRLEAARVALANPGYRADPTGAVRVAAVLVHEVARFVHARVDPRTVPRPHADSLAAADRFVAAAEMVVGPPPRKWLGLVTVGPAARSGRRDECLWVLHDLPLVLERCFALLGTGFRHTRPAVDWVDTSGVFLSEIKSGLAWVEAADADRG